MKILTAEQMREIDRLTVERCGIPYATLMETAGSRVVDAIIDTYGPVEAKLFRVICGKGNNGGDGAVIARLLWMRGARVILSLLSSIDEVKGEARVNLEAVKRIAIDDKGIVFEENEIAFSGSHPDFVIDAIFGTGLTRPAEDKYAFAIDAINKGKERFGYRVISVDIPSGLPSDSGAPFDPHINADLTVTFTAPKIGNVLSPAFQFNGKLVIASIGTPAKLIEEESGSHLSLIECDRIADWLKSSRRTADAHKASVGDCLLIAGSLGKTGAAALASETVLRAGAGLLTVATSRSAQAWLVNQIIPEVMTEGLEETENGSIAYEAIGQALSLAEKKTVLAVGPGLSSADRNTRSFVREFVERRVAPIIIDADGLNALSPWPEEITGTRELPIVITPHPGEMARLTGKTNAEIVADRIGVACEFAKKHRIITVLKGSRTLIASPEGQVYVNPTGNAGMATAGSGDVLTGLAAGLLAQRPQDPLTAAIAAVYLHGLAGDIAAEEIGIRSLIASDIIAKLSEAILRVGGDEERGEWRNEKMERETRKISEKR